MTTSSSSSTNNSSSTTISGGGGGGLASSLAGAISRRNGTGIRSQHQQRRRDYSRVGTDDDMVDSLQSDTTAASAANAASITSITNTSTTIGGGVGAANDQNNQNNNNKLFTVIVLDSAHTKFPIPNVYSQMTIQEFQKYSSKYHKVPPSLQRLIYRGKMLSSTSTTTTTSTSTTSSTTTSATDETKLKTLGDYGIVPPSTSSVANGSKKKKKKKKKKKQQDEEDDEETSFTPPEIIIHLFPKPRVVVMDENTTTTTTAKSSSSSSSHHLNQQQQQDDNEDDEDEEEGTGTGGGGAHIPQIRLNSEEAERRGSILVLGSVEIGEAQNNVRVLSLLLLVVCGMRLLNLAVIASAVDVPPTPEYDHNNTTNITGTASYDDPYQNASLSSSSSSSSNTPMLSLGYDDEFTSTSTSTSYGGGYSYDTSNNNGEQDEYQVRPWQSADYFDLTVSSVGFCVAWLGMKATTENTLRLATVYWIGTIISGILWNAWNILVYIVFVRDETEWEQHSDTTDGKDTDTDDDTGTNGPHPPIPNTTTDDPDENSEIYTLSLDDYVTVAFFTVVMPALVWFMCCSRAYTFRRLLQDAEVEAAERFIQHQEQEAQLQEELNEAATATTTSSRTSHNDDGHEEEEEVNNDQVVTVEEDDDHHRPLIV